MRLPKFHSTKDGQFIACCPAHRDRNPSLSIGVNTDGAILLTCFAGCPTADIVAALRMRQADLFPVTEANITVKKPVRRLPAVPTAYKAITSDGKLVGIHMRRDFLHDDATPYRDKKIWWQDHHGRSPKDMPLYGLPRLLQAPHGATVIVTEGEKTCEALNAAGALAVATMCGASTVPNDNALRPLLRYRPILWPDNDDPGEQHMRRIAERLFHLGMPPNALSRVRWTEAPPKGDAANYLAQGGDVLGIAALCHEINEDNENDAQKSHEADESNENNENNTEQNSYTSYFSWPRPMREEAFIGPIGRFVRKIGPDTEASQEALLVQGLVAAGSAMGRSAFCMAEADEHHVNLYAVVVAGTGARKGTSWGQDRRFLRMAAPKWVDEHIVGGLSSGEGLINAVRDDEPAIPDKAVLAYEPEFAGVFKVKGRDGNTLSTILRQGWDGSTLAALTRTAPLKATGAHISLIGHITPEELRQQLSLTDIANGFANRILWVCAKRARFLADGGNVESINLNLEVQQLRASIDFAKTAGRIRRDDDASELWRSVYRRLTTPRPGVLGLVTGRAESQVLRLSLLYALLDCSPTIGKKHLEAALAVWDYCIASAGFIFGATSGNALADDIYAELSKRADAGMTRTEISDHLGRNRSKDDIDHALGALEGQGLAEPRRETGDGGRSITRWYATFTSHDENNESNEPNPRDEYLDSYISSHAPQMSVCRVTGGRHIYAKQRTADGRLVCTECQKSPPRQWARERKT